MDAGMTLMFSGEDCQILDNKEVDHGADSAAVSRELALAAMAEPLGFSSVWAPEHHFTSYAMSPDPLQFLAYMAAKTTKVRLGTMVLVSPWHNPARLAGSISALDNLSSARVTLGFGRGLSRMEFSGLGVDINDSTELFARHTTEVLDGLENGYLTLGDGTTRAVRPVPVRSFRDRAYAAAMSSGSYQNIARLGIGLLIIPQAPWSHIVDNVRQYRSIFEDVHGTPAPDPILACQVFCDNDAVRARDLGQQYVGEYYESCLKHYELGGSHFSELKGYSHYAENSAMSSVKSQDEVLDEYCDLHCIGTPKECIEKIHAMRESVQCGEVLGMFSYAGLSLEESSKNVRLFAESVIPVIADF